MLNNTYFLRATSTLALGLAIASTQAIADHAPEKSANGDYVASRPDAHAPIGVMRDHIHGAGEVMLSYRFGYMYMDGNRDSTQSLSDQQVLNDFMVTPTKMPMKMHMVGAMYGVTDNLTLSAMGGFATKEMDNLRANGTEFSMETRGITDTTVNALYEFYNDGANRVQFNAGLSIPTGDLDETMANGNIMGYPMQLGSGTYDLKPGLSYSGVQDGWSWGSQFNATVRLGKNDRAYTLGDSYQLTAWGARQLSDMFSVSVRLDGQAWEDVDGRDQELQGPMFMSPVMRDNLRAGERVDALIGVNFIMPEGPLKGHRLAAEAGTPIYQRLDGPQLETDYRFTLGWQWAF